MTSLSARSKTALAAVAAVVLVGGVVGITHATADGPATSAACSAPSWDNGSGQFSINCTLPPQPAQTVTETQTVTQTVTATPPPTSSSPSPSTTPRPTKTTTSPAPTTSAVPTPSDTTTPAPPPQGGAVTSGQQITTSNTGMAAWVGPNGETCTNPTVYTSKVSASSLGANVTCAWFKKGVSFDRDITITATRFDTSIDTNGHTANLNWVNVDTVSVEDIGIHGEGSFNLYRCTVTGSSDAIRFDGDNIVESYLRTKAESAADHNDAVQAYQADSGGSILRSNIDGKPVNAAQYNIGAGNAAVFFADGSKGNVDLEGNYLSGGGYTMRLNEAMIYTHVRDNVVVKGSYLYGPLDTTNSVKGAFPDWSGNALSDGAVIKP